MKRLDQLSGFFWLFISIIVCVESISVRIGSFQNPGPGFLPFGSGIALGTLAIILLITSTMKKRIEGKVISIREVDLAKVILFLISIFLYALFLSWIGYLIMTLGLILFLLIIMERSRLWIKIIISIFIVLTSYVIFYKLLNINLPRGLFWF
jgi:hypothetical protein